MISDLSLYGKEYELNQSDMMLTFFAHVLNKHQDIVDELLRIMG